MPVRVRLFAALRDAAGAASTTVDAGKVSEVLDVLRERYGEPFTSRLTMATVVVDGEEVDRGEDLVLEGHEDVVLLPPFSGG